MFLRQGAIIREFFSNRALSVQQVFQAFFTHTSVIKLTSLKILKFKLHIHIAATPVSQNDKAINATYVFGDLFYCNVLVHFVGFNNIE
jgi:hypothetical protein